MVKNVAWSEGILETAEIEKKIKSFLRDVWFLFAGKDRILFPDNINGSSFQT